MDTFGPKLKITYTDKEAHVKSHCRNKHSLTIKEGTRQKG